MKNRFPKVVVVVLFYKNPQDVEDCLGSLDSVDYPKENLDIFVIDNFSQDRELTERLRNYSDKIIFVETDKNLGYAAGNNIGIEYGLKNDFDYIYILNPDTEVKSDFLKNAVDCAERNDEVGIVQSKILLWDKRDRIQTSGNKIHYTGICYSGGFNKVDNLDGNPFEIAYASGAGMLIRASALRPTGGFNTSFFMYHEDVDLGWTMRLYGHKIFIEPSSIIFHKYSFSRNVGKYFWMERNRWWVILKNYKIGTLLVFAPALIALEIMLLIYSALNGWFLKKIKSYPATLGGLKNIWQKRKIVQKARIIGDKEFLKFTDSKLEFSGMTEGGLIRIVNIFFGVYFEIAKRLIIW